ncbi:MAG TPA: methyltransferase [Thermoplasmata archaeon]|nr:methyltransferase [Thermoplasmata archaeon]
MRPVSPAERVRRRLRAEGLDEAAERVPARYERLGSVLLLRLAESDRAFFGPIARGFRQELGVSAVLRHAGPVRGEERALPTERLDGEATETTVLEHGVRYRFDAARILFSRGNKTERSRIGGLVAPGERVVDLFAGIGYFTLPAARAHPTVQVEAVERNPVAFAYLEQNLRLNAVTDQVRAQLGDNRTVALPEGTADRILLGYLHSSLPWVPQTLRLLAPAGGWVHLHELADATAPDGASLAAVEKAVERSGGRLREGTVRRVKNYGPGRVHVVVDAYVVPRR